MSIDPTIREVFESTPINRFLGYRLESRTRDEAVLAMPVRTEYVQEAGAIQGGIISALADTAAAYVLLPEAVTDGRRGSGVEFKMNFLLPAFDGAGDLVARARRIKVGRRVAVCAVDVQQGDRHVAHGTFTYLLYRAGEDR